MTAWVLGVDSGGTGVRVALAAVDAGRPEPVGVVGPLTADPVPTGPDGISADALSDRLLPAARRLREAVGEPDGEVAAVCVGAAGMATLGADLRATLPGVLRQALGVRRLALAADAVTAYAGALGERPGAVVAAGTGLIALGTDLVGWRRADGWGHLLGDCGGGAWIGRAGLEAAARAHDGRPGGSAPLLRRAEELFGPVERLPERLYPRADRPAVLASFAPRVGACAAEGDPVAVGILADAAREIAASAAAALPARQDDVQSPAQLAVVGGLLGLGEPLLGPLRKELSERLPDVPTHWPESGPLDGALRLAAGLCDGRRTLPADGRLLTLH
ncbi:N-acetylglucosamine kinase [Streptomyces alkaliterrae]|uniref:N-acetylglucosamine kinase n=1 Tax=Streptomyces alkaliterrae TaxID=2213162 RepID=UPI002B214C84|nr:BadF/BadG/BcrA/BcrD ATPase family protein [Streptomyces alkaliterrae]